MVKVAFLNLENLFINLDKHPGESQLTRDQLETMTEREWQNLASGLTPNKPLRKTLDCAATLLAMDPDIILLVEVGGYDSIHSFNQLFLSSHYQVYYGPTASDRGIDMAYLCKSKFKLRLLSHQERELPHPTYKKFARDVLQADLMYQGQLKAHFFLVHLKSKLNLKKTDFEGRTQRQVEVTGLSQIIRETQEKSSLPIILMGDFNGETYPEVLEPEFYPLYHLADLKNLFFEAHFPEAERWTYLFWRQGQKIAQQLDSIFVSSAALKAYVPGSLAISRFVTHEGRALPVPDSPSKRSLLPTDHYPLYCEFELYKAL
jgi:endonuclease/exonuclease/phosphatase family metal-dependent hydrolase